MIVMCSSSALTQLQTSSCTWTQLEGKMILCFSVTSIRQLHSLSQPLIVTLLGETSFTKTAHMLESTRSAKEIQLWPILTYSTCLETNKEQLNTGWKHLLVLYFIYRQKKEKEIEILCRAYVCFTVCPASNSCQVVIYLLQQTIYFPAVSGSKQ